MFISSQFNRHFHGITLKQIWDANIEMRVHLGRFIRTVFPKGSETDRWDFDTFKQKLKEINLDYPRERLNNKPYSTKNVTSMQLRDHVLWLESCCVDLPEYIKEEIKRDEILSWSNIETKFEG